MITTQHVCNMDNGLNLYIEAQDNGQISISIQAHKSNFVMSESEDYMYFRGKLKVHDLEELSNFFEIAFDCSL